MIWKLCNYRVYGNKVFVSKYFLGILIPKRTFWKKWPEKFQNTSFPIWLKKPFETLFLKEINFSDGGKVHKINILKRKMLRNYDFEDKTTFLDGKCLFFQNCLYFSKSSFSNQTRGITGRDNKNTGNAVVP